MEGEKFTEFSDSVFSLASREADNISFNSAMVFSSSDLTNMEEEDEEEGKGQGVRGVETGDGVTLVDDRYCSKRSLSRPLCCTDIGGATRTCLVRAMSNFFRTEML